MKRLGLTALVTAGIACGPAPNLLPINDFNRPTDVAFMCFGAFPQGGGGPDAGAAQGSTTGPLQVSGRPMQACHPQDAYDPGATTTTRTFAFMPNSAAGTLSAVDADHWKLLDLDLDTGGYGTAPLGQDPEQISVSDDGCRLISANRASCDLTIVDPSVLVAPQLSSENGGASVLQPPSPRSYGQTFRPIKGDGTPLISAPYEAVFLPQNTSALLTPSSSPNLPLLPTQNVLCGDNAAVDPAGWTGPPTPNTWIPNSWYVLVTYPSCDLVALVALPSGKIVDSAYVRQAGNNNVKLVEAGKVPVCPISNCAGQALPPGTAAASADASSADSGSSTPAPAGDGAADMSADASGPAGTSDAASAPGTGGAAGAVAGAGGTGGSVDAGSAGGGSGTSGGALIGNQYADTPYFGQPGEPLGPSSIAIVPGGSQAYISLANASFVVSVGLSNGSLSPPFNSIYLHNGARGSTRIRLNVDPTRSALPGVAGVFVGAQEARDNEVVVPATSNGAPVPGAPPSFPGVQPDRMYLYAIARDGTLRVIHVNVAGAETECETNVDPLSLPSAYPASTACIPVDASYRRPFSVGPGIQFPALPIDVAAADIADTVDLTSEQSLNGAHAWVITDSGTVYLVNINPVLRLYQAVTQYPPGTGYPAQPIATSESVPFVNTIRDRNQISYSVVLDSLSGPPRVDVLPAIPPTGPYVEPLWTQGSILNATAVSSLFVKTVAFFPQAPLSPLNQLDPIDRGAITPQTWTISWEGPLAGQRNTGIPLPANVGAVDSTFQDNGSNFCQLGTVPGDLVTLTGCTNDGQCGIGETCVQSEGVSSVGAGLTVTGLCVDPNRVSERENTCAEFLNSVRRYQIVSAQTAELQVRPNLDEIVISPLKPECHPASSTDGGAPPDGGTGDGGAPLMDSCPDPTDPTTNRFTCESSYPGTGTGKRCLMLCKTDSDCRGGRTCVDFDDGLNAGNSGLATGNPCAGDSTKRCFCAEAPVFDAIGKSCFDQLVNYQLSAGKSFVVAGSTTGLVNTAPLPPDGVNCSPNPTSSDPRFTYRIPMNAPACTNVDPSVVGIDSRIDPDSLGGTSTPAGLQAIANAQTLVNVATSTPAPQDPCLYLGGPVAGDPVTATGVDGGAGVEPTHVRALFQNAQLSFVLANLDRSPTTQFLTSFDVHGGFGPQSVYDPTTIEVSMPARIILGPVDSLSQVTSGPIVAPSYEAPYLFVVDQRRLGRSQGGGPTRGQLLRINPLSYTVTVGNATGYQPIFEDYNASGGLFPIQ